MAEIPHHIGIKYTGTNADRLAMTTTDTPSGTFFVESDTDEVYVWSNAWIRWQVEEEGVILGVVAKGADYTATATDYTILVTCAAANITITLPAVANNTGRIYNVKKLDATAWTVIVDGDGVETIDGALTQTLLAQYDSIQVQCDSTEWWII